MRVGTDVQAPDNRQGSAESAPLRPEKISSSERTGLGCYLDASVDAVFSAGNPTGVSNQDQDQAQRVADFIARALELARHGDEHDDAYWEVVRNLQRSDGDLVSRIVSPMTDSADPVERALVPDVLRWVGEGDRSRRERTVEILGAMLSTEKDARVLTAIGLAFVDLSHPAAVDWMPQYGM